MLGFFFNEPTYINVPTYVIAPLTPMSRLTPSRRLHQCADISNHAAYTNEPHTSPRRLHQWANMYVITPLTPMSLTRHHAAYFRVRSTLAHQWRVPSVMTLADAQMMTQRKTPMSSSTSWILEYGCSSLKKHTDHAWQLMTSTSLWLEYWKRSIRIKFMSSQIHYF